MINFESLRRRTAESFAQKSPRDVFESRRAIIGSRTDQLVQEAEDARELLLRGKEPSPRQLAALEYSLRLLRPAPTCNAKGLTQLPDSSHPFGGLWDGFRERLQQIQSSVARLDRVDDPMAIGESGRTPLGTGFLVGRDLILTAAHVVDQLSYGTGRLEQGQALAEFFGYYGATGREPCGIMSVVAYDQELDLALLQLDSEALQSDSRPILESRAADLLIATPIAVIGFPLEDPRNRSAFISIVFGKSFAVKRAALGAVIDQDDKHFLHDCSTLGGNSGSPVYDLRSGEICGVHVSGRALASNQAVQGKLVAEFLFKNQVPPFHSSTGRHIARNHKMSKRPDFNQYLEQLKQVDSEVFNEVEATREERVTTAETFAEGGPPAPPSLETIVLTQGRPVLDVKQGAVVLDIQEVESHIWKQRLIDASRLIAPHIPAVGRIELSNHPRGLEWLGTGWLLRDNIVVTNRHVVEVFGEANGASFVFRPGFDGSPMQANIDFLEEFDGDGIEEFPLLEIVHIERGGGPDLAFLRVEPVRGHDLPGPIPLTSATVQGGDQVAVIGYPARDPFFPDPDLMDRIFNHRYDKKRFAPGMIIGKTSDRIFHDCSTLGGNSGGEVVSLKTGNAVALHFAGTLFTKNHAVPIDVVAQRLDDVLAGRTHPSVTPARRDPEVPNLQSASVASRRYVEATIPIKVRVEIGDVVIASQPNVQVTSPKRPPAFDLDADDDLIETTEARPEDYRDRKGYQVDFLGDGFEVPFPVLTQNKDDALSFTFDGKQQPVLHYQNFSVVMSQSRRMCRYSACNIDGKQSKRTSRTGWQFDPRIPKSAQIMKECYGNPPKFSRGHMTRREDPAWGRQSQADQGNRDSMHITNAVPQIQPFNGGIWLALEDYALQNARKDDQRISVFTGPFLAMNDPFRFDVKIPITFWKVIAFIHDETGELCATGYTMSQKSFIGEEEFIFGRHENNQRPITEIERRAGVSFGPLAELDPLKDEPESTRNALFTPQQIRFVR